MTFKHQPLPTKGEAVDTNAEAVMVTDKTPSVLPMEVEEPVFEGVEWDKGELQPPAYRDKYFAIAFLLHLIAVTIVACVMGIPDILRSDASAGDHFDNGSSSSSNNAKEDDLAMQEENPNAEHYAQDDILDTSTAAASSSIGSIAFAVLMFIGVSALAAIVLSLVALLLMHQYSDSCVKAAFVASPVLFVLFGLAMLASGDDAEQSFAAWWCFCALISVCFAYIYWKFIPFASVNLKTALTAIGNHYGVVSVSFLVVTCGTLFSVVWWIAVYGIIQNAPAECYDATDDTTLNSDECRQDFSGIYMILLLLSYYWTHYTLQGVTRVTVAGTVGTWWFEPGVTTRPSCCSNAVRDSLSRSLTYSFGSICMGSLIVAIVETLRQMARNRRGRGAAGILVCVIQCILACLRDILEYINSWAFVYVGLYGYSFVDSAKNVFHLFRSRGWSTIISNSLVVRTLILFNLLVGAVTGLVSLFVGYLCFGEFSGLCYGVGLAFGIVLGSIVLTVVDGAVKTAIVCFAEAPNEFQTNHPGLYQQMTETYLSTYPQIFDTTSATTTTPTVAAVPLT